ncbi:NnrS family protein [Alcanivorax quisquiliarum]|uniref:NnrS family protein n=1 Tax=Alcanivorax quisquiliarum TaxID=2933565 RepID=A0ABT0EAE2_9GAMM|nr:NnrS family protein [Alcanivorax quisquiliarum]MCK0538774.1 NnrS family protein [Alcanivorax quisquiliarum]
MKPSASLSTLVAYPFRIFFLSLAIWALAVVALWVPIISGQLQWPLAWPALVWHQHEMLFGVLNAAIAGFLLTAVCVWTNTERLHGGALLALWLVWLAGRLLATFGQGVPEMIVVGVNLVFLPLVMLDAGWRIRAARQHRHLIVLAVLGLIWAMQAGFLLVSPLRFAEAALLATSLLMMVIGGRITPAFSRNWLQRQGRDAAAVRTIPALERLVIVTLLLVVLAVVTGWPAQLVALLAVLAASTGGVRLLLWRGWLVRAEPLLWILHLSLWWIPVALLLLAGARLGWWPASAWLHAAGVGAMGGLILGVIARVSLGHTGRALVLPGGMAMAFILLHAGAVIRVLTAFTVLPWKAGVVISGLCWVIAFALFVWRYTAILASPRVDGKPG